MTTIQCHQQSDSASAFEWDKGQQFWDTNIPQGSQSVLLCHDEDDDDVQHEEEREEVVL